MVLQLGGSWSGNGIVSTGLYTLTAAGTFDFTYSFGSGNCLTTDAVSLTVNALPVVDAGSDIAMCVNAGLQILSGAPIGGTWTGVGITNSSGDFDPNVAGVGIHTLYYSYTDINACSNIDSMIVTVFDLPIVYAG